MIFRVRYGYSPFERQPQRDFSTSDAANSYLLSNPLRHPGANIERIDNLTKVVVKLELENGTPVSQVEIQCERGRESGVIRMVCEMLEENMGGEVV